MTPKRCGKCGNALNADVSVCPSCGAPQLPADSRLPANGQSAPRRHPLKVLVAVCLVAGLAFAVWLMRPLEKAATPPVEEMVNVEDIRAKAERGEAEAQMKLGTVFAQGRQVKQDYREAAKWYRLAADQGQAGGQNALGELYEAGQGVHNDDAEAAKWYRRAAEQGLTRAEYNLAVLYVVGKGVPRDEAEAVKWYRKAADHGEALAQYNLGMRYSKGQGVPADLVEAYKWLSLAAAQGLPDASTARKELHKRMTREQVNDGRRRAEAFTAPR